MKRLALLLCLAGCTGTPQPISTVPLSGLPGSSTVQQGLVDAAYNLNSAISIGVLPADDPAAACVNQTLTTLGINPTTGVPTQTANSFVPRESDLISAGAVAYIYAQQAGNLLNGGLVVPVGCEALIGKLVLDSAKLASQLGIGIPGLPKLPFPLAAPTSRTAPPPPVPAYRPNPLPPPSPPKAATIEPSPEQIAAYGQTRMAADAHQWSVP